MSALTVVAAGIASTIQDRGRRGFAHLGVPAGGSVDPVLAALVNRLVGNDEDSAVIETCGGLVVRADGAVLVATTADGASSPLADGDVVELPPGHGRVWHYLAVRGGLDVAPVLGSRATDTLSGLGPPPITDGAQLSVGADPGTSIDADRAPLRAVRSVVRMSLGPRTDWFAADALDRLVHGEWTVAASSRVGVRLAGVGITRVDDRELPSEGLVRGAIQIPPDGNPVMMLADHPTTGGYPVIAVVHPDDVAVIAQTSAGRRVRFRL